MKIAIIVIAVFLGIASLTLIIGAIVYGLRVPIDREKKTDQNEEEVYKELVAMLVIKEKEKTQ